MINIERFIRFYLLLLIALPHCNAYAQKEFGNENGVKVIENNVSLVYKDTLILPSFVEFELPVRMKPASKVSAILVGFYYPQEFLEIDTVMMIKGVKGYHYSITDSSFLLSWSDINPVSIGENDTLMTLGLNALDLSVLDETIRLELYEFTEFADSTASILEGIILEIPEIYYKFPDPQDTVYGTSVRVFPNTFDEYITVDFSLKYESRIRLSLYNPEGVKFLEKQETTYPEGVYQERIYAADLSKGIYLLKFEIRNSEGEFERVFKIMSLR